MTAPQEPLTLATVVGDAPAFTFQADGLKRPPLIAVRTADEKEPWRIVWETGPHGRYRDLDHMENDYLLYGGGPINLDTVAPLGPLHPARDDAAELRAAIREWSKANRACSQWVAGTVGNDQDELPLARLSRAERHLHALAASEEES